MAARLVSSRMRLPDGAAAGVRTLGTVGPGGKQPDIVTILEFFSLTPAVNPASRRESSGAVDPPTTGAPEADFHRRGSATSSHPDRSDSGPLGNRNHLRARHPP